jgi:hypothetical protein
MCTQQFAHSLHQPNCTRRTDVHDMLIAWVSFYNQNGYLYRQELKDMIPMWCISNWCWIYHFSKLLGKICAWTFQLFVVYYVYFKIPAQWERVIVPWTAWLRKRKVDWKCLISNSGVGVEHPGIHLKTRFSWHQREWSCVPSVNSFILAGRTRYVALLCREVVNWERGV